MSFDLRPIPAPGPSLEQALRGRPGFSTPVMVTIAALIALLGMGLMVMLDYNLRQDPHRLIKVVLGLLMVGAIALRPRVGLFALPVLTPFMSWLPRIPAPGLNMMNVLILTVFAAWGLQRVMRREPLFRANRLGMPMLAIVIVAALSIVRGAAFPTGYTFNALTASVTLVRSAMTFAIYFVVLSMATGPADRRRLTYAVVIGLAFEAAITIVLGRTGRGARAVGSFDQSNDLGAFLAMFIPFTVALIPAARGAWTRAMLFGTSALGVLAVVYSVSRGALLALTLGMLFVGFRTSKLITALVLVVLATSPLWAPDYLKQRLSGTEVQVEGTDEKVIEAGAQVRVDTWRAIGTLVRDHPIDGVGFSGLYYVLPEAGEALGVQVKDSSHNTYLRFLAEMGIGGLALFLWLLARCFALASGGARQAILPLDRQAGVGLTGATIAMAVSCMFGDRFFSILITGNYWVACAIAEDVIQERRRERLQAAAAARVRTPVAGGAALVPSGAKA